MTLTLNDKMRLTGGILGGAIGCGVAICTFAAIIDTGNQIKKGAAAQLEATRGINQDKIAQVIPKEAKSAADLAGRIAATARNVADAGVADAASATQTVIKSLK